MNTPQDLPPDPPLDAPPVANLDLKARLLLAAVALLLAGAVAYVMYARGAFERTQRLVLVAEHAEGAAVGMDLSFSGFPIGRVSRIELGDDGRARIVIDVARKDARWLRTSSVFTMESSLVGAPRIRAFSGILNDPPLPDGAERPVLIGDATAEIPRLMADARNLLANLSALTADDAPLSRTLGNLQATTEKLNGPGGALGALMGQNAQQILTTLERTNVLLARLDGLAQKADSQVFGERGLLRDTQTSVQQLNALLGEARQSLKKVDALLQEAQGIAGNAREATADLGQLRAEVEASLRKVEQLLTEVNRRWPFNKRDTEIRLP
ncbi:MAG TPA: MlaD family protein [Roseateles sp.]|nr:MlaD family protein [Roseateles sp.]